MRQDGGLGISGLAVCDFSVEEMDRVLGIARIALVVRDKANGCTFSVQFAEKGHDGVAIF